jgi:hypothetical protein
MLWLLKLWEDIRPVVEANETNEQGSNRGPQNDDTRNSPQNKVKDII